LVGRAVLMGRVMTVAACRRWRSSNGWNRANRANRAEVNLANRTDRKLRELLGVH
jgi:hypothetical protein